MKVAQRASGVFVVMWEGAVEKTSRDMLVGVCVCFGSQLCYIYVELAYKLKNLS